MECFGTVTFLLLLMVYILMGAWFGVSTAG
jgi:hypothetical protein